MVLVIPLESSLTTSIQEIIMRIIKNSSVYNTRKLNSLFCMIHNQLAKPEGRLPQWKRLKVIVRNGNNSGRALIFHHRSEIGTKWDMMLSLGTGIETISQVFAHELMHNYGYRHRQFRSDPLDEHHLDEIKQRFSSHNELK